jgi:hypothetical protein
LSTASDATSWWQPRWGVPEEAGPDAGWPEPDASSAWAANDEHVSSDDPILTSLEEEFRQIRSRDRVRDLAEVFTHQREIDAMLDMIPDAFEHLDIKFLEPSCGSGNFLVEILRRKLASVSKRDTVSQEQYEHRMLRALASIYAIDISTENVQEAHVRMAHVMLEHYEMDGNTIEPTVGFLSAVNLIIHANLIEADSLADPWGIEMCDWQPRAGGRFQRVWSAPLVPEDERGLLWSERAEDDEPVHYSEMASNRKAVKEQRWI